MFTPLGMFTHECLLGMFTLGMFTPLGTDVYSTMEFYFCTLHSIRFIRYERMAPYIVSILFLIFSGSPIGYKNTISASSIIIMISYKNTISGGSSIMYPIRITENTRNGILLMNLITTHLFTVIPNPC